MPKSIDVAGFMAMSSFWGLNYIMVKFALLYEPPLMLLLFRVMFAAIFSLFLIKGGLKFPRDLVTNLKMVILSALNITLFMGLWFIGEGTESASISSILVYTYPIFSIIFSSIFLADRIGPLTVAGSVLGFAGIVLIFVDQLSISPGIGLILLLLSALSWAGGTIFYKKYIHTTHPATVNAIQYIYALPFITVWAFATESFSLSGITWQFLLISLYIGVLGTAVAYFIYLKLYREYSVPAISSYFFLVPALSILFSFLILGQTNTIFTYGGFALVAVGIYLTSRSQRNMGNEPQSISL
ncbi:putative DMT superfamily transporter inner membrane protein [Thermoplasmatales archaeon]|nr:putative DMT superfamily transporter inner membrane protein [Thermoplasmatales archaeon]